MKNCAGDDSILKQIGLKNILEMEQYKIQF